MSDISKCPGKDCTLREDCHRFTAPVNEYKQSYFTETPEQKDGVCEYFWSNKDYVKESKTK